MTRHDLSITLPWLRDGTDRLLAVVDRITDEELRAPSGLPGWTRAHVVGHLARNAEALGRLAGWAHTRVETPMYADSTQRAAEIESSATLPPAVLRHDLATTAVQLDHALAGLDDVAWHSSVRSALGRTIPAAEIPWLRVREVWLHAVDLAAGATVGDLPDELVDALLGDVTETLSARPGCPSVSLAPTDRDHGWCLGPAMTEPPVVAATAAKLLAWLVGRDDGPVTLPRWL